MPARLRPTASIAAGAILVGDPGRALMLAQELLDQPKMCNHARGLWGYTGMGPAGQPLTIQSTGMGGPSAALVLGDLAELGVRRAVRVGTCAAIAPEPRPGELLVPLEAHPWPGGIAGNAVLPAVHLTARLREELDDRVRVRPAILVSLDHLHESGSLSAHAEIGDAADMQTAALFARAAELEVAIAAVLIVTEDARGEELGDESLDEAAKRAGRAAAAIL